MSIARKIARLLLHFLQMSHGTWGQYLIAPVLARHLRPKLVPISRFVSEYCVMWSARRPLFVLCDRRRQTLRIYLKIDHGSLLTPFKGRKRLPALGSGAIRFRGIFSGGIHVKTQPFGG
jgi:hypothetical protein